jgi:hypothetical protein
LISAKVTGFESTANSQAVVQKDSNAGTGAYNRLPGDNETHAH